MAKAIGLIGTLQTGTLSAFLSAFDDASASVYTCFDEEGSSQIEELHILCGMGVKVSQLSKTASYLKPGALVNVWKLGEVRSHSFYPCFNRNNASPRTTKSLLPLSSFHHRTLEQLLPRNSFLQAISRLKLLHLP